MVSITVFVGIEATEAVDMIEVVKSLAFLPPDLKDLVANLDYSTVWLVDFLRSSVLTLKAVSRDMT